ncbi:KTSC domain-containing protein [Winogradskyella ludwigii]|jgi:curved DNA-binding protein CbpA|uniref:KTSC domain-containing protein n=1 Tax=Winogradskyella ludwigii TaxID=2686076 RepID=UPI0015C77EFF|nr:KTSC domain-containing protein [Winogradskyella ludwigii]
MKRINQYKKLFSIEEGPLDLKTLKKTYRNLVKEWHPDKFQDGDEGQEEAELKSVEIIDGYHFLVSIAPETRAANLEEYTNTITNSTILDFQHKGLLLEITFQDGATYEYFGVPKGVFIKFLNSDKQMRFARRSIFNSYTYRKSKKELQEG